MRLKLWMRGMLLVGVGAPSVTSEAQTINTTFTYQGQLKQNGTPVNETCDFAFTLWPDTDGFVIALATLVFDGQPGNGDPIDVRNGLFVVELDYGTAVFNGDPLALEVSVRCPAGAGEAMTPLLPWQPITAAPYAVRTRGILVDEAGHVSIGPANPALQTTTAGDPPPPVLAVEGDSDFTGDVDIAGDVDMAGAVRLRAPLAAATTAGNPPGMELVQNTIRSTDGNLEINENNAYATRINNTLHVGTNSNVGIGTTNPTARLHLQNSDSEIALKMRASASWTAELKQTNSSFLSLVNGGSERLTIAPNGDVGIGTTTPAARVEMIGPTHPQLSLRSSDVSGDDAGIRIRGSRNASTTADVAYIELRDFDSDEGPTGTDFPLARISGGMESASGQNGNLRFQTSAAGVLTERMRIDAWGNVGIGAPNPIHMLHLQSAGSTTIHLEADTNNSGEADQPQITMSQDGGIITGGIGFFDSSNSMSIRTFDTGAGAPHLLLNPEGNVGIGTTTPAAKLDVSGDARISGDLVMGMRTCTIRRWPFDFQPTEGGKLYTLKSFGIEVPLSAAGQSTTFVSQLHFPEGARLTAMRAVVEDTSASHEITVEFRSGSGIEDYAVSRSTVAIPNLTTLSANLNHVVNTTGSTSTYFVRASWTRPPSGLGDINLRWVEFDYETDQICPPR